METPKTPNSQSNLEREECNAGINIPDSDYITKPQSSRWYGTGTKRNIDQWNKTEISIINPCTYEHLVFDKGCTNMQ